ncbi:MAG: phosphoribosyltransferase [Gemmatimonadaceae bacterium]
MKFNEHMGEIAVDSPARFMRVFRDRADAGIRLAEHLGDYADRDALILGLARGGVPVAAEVARALEGELDVVVARKLGAPTSRELAIGAVTADGGFYVNKQLIRELAIPTQYVERLTAMEMAEARRQEERFRFGPPPNVNGRTVVLIDDGLATGATMIAAARSVRGRSPSQLVVGVPVGSAEACEELRAEADDVVCLVTPRPFWAVGLYYQDFGQIDDDEVVHLLQQTRR